MFQVTGSSLGLGMLCYTLSKMGHPGVAALRQTLTSQWMKAVTSAETAPMEKIAALNGLMAMIGSEQTLTVVGDAPPPPTTTHTHTRI